MTFALVALLYCSQGMATISEELMSLYPHLSKKVMSERFENAKSEFQFHRAFVPYFYSLTKRHAKVLTEFTHIQQSGWCVGDAHPENFGTLSNDQHQVSFSVNDADDSGPCPLYLDTLRFLTSLVLWDPDIDLDPVLEAYRDGVAGRSRNFSKSILELLDEAQTKDHKAPKKYVDDKKFINDELEAADDNLVAEVRALVKREFNSQWKILDVATRIKMSGGSGGLLRVLAYVEKDSGKKFVLEFKEMVVPGIFPVATSKIPDIKTRVEKTLMIEQGLKSSETQKLVMLQNKVMMSRPRWEGNRGIRIDKYSAEKAIHIVTDEAWVLGNIHRISSDDLVTYQEHLPNVATKIWKTAAKFFANEEVDAFRSLKKGL